MLLSTFIHKFVCEHLFSVLLGIYPRVEFLGHFSSIQYRSVASDSLQPHRLQHTRLPYPSPTPGACSLMSIGLVMPSNHLILCCPLLLPPSIFPSIRVFSNESGSSHQVAKVLELQLQHQSFQCIFRVDFL